MTNPDWVNDLLKEKSLVEIARTAKSFTPSKFDHKMRLTFLTGTPLIIAPCFWCYLTPSQEALMVKSLASNLVAYSTTVLGFLIAGLAVFTTLSEKKIWIALAQSQVQDEKVSAFKYLFFNMLSVFIIYLLSVVCSVVVSVVAAADLRIPDVAISDWEFESATWINAITLIALAIVFFESTLRLKSFIWNIYSTFISMLTVKWLLEERGE
jgi:hypothetical protein